MILGVLNLKKLPPDLELTQDRFAYIGRGVPRWNPGASRGIPEWLLYEVRAGSIYGNQFPIARGTPPLLGLPAYAGRSRAESVEAYRLWLQGRPDCWVRQGLAALDGRTLLCWCHPALCHGNVWVDLSRAAA